MKTKVIVVKTIEDFEKIRLIRGDARIIVILANDIDFKNNEFLTLLKPYASVIMYGMNHSISNVVIKGNGSKKVGFFGNLRNLYIRGVNFNNITVEGYKEVGSIAGDVSENVNLKDANVKSNVTGYDFVGGVVGSCDHFKIVDSKVDTTVHAQDLYGSVVGFSSSYDDENLELTSNDLFDKCGFTIKNYALRRQMKRD